MNQFFFIGNLTKDPEVRTTNAGIKVCNFTIAINRRMKNNGEQQTDFFNIVAWRQLAELCEKYLSKGKKVAITGSIQVRNYEDKNGIKRTAVDFLADEVEFLSPADKGARKEMEYRAEERQAIMNEGNTPADSGFTQVDDSELPF
jgi:single-strand DNA-binding protein